MSKCKGEIENFEQLQTKKKEEKSSFKKIRARGSFMTMEDLMEEENK